LPASKSLPSRTDFGPFLTAAASGTGQPLTSYVKHPASALAGAPFVAPGGTAKPAEFHLVLIDNGPSRMRKIPVLHERSTASRCSAVPELLCQLLNGGRHAFAERPILAGIAVFVGGRHRYADERAFPATGALPRVCERAMSGRIDIPWLNENLRQRMNREQPPSAAKVPHFGAHTGSAERTGLRPCRTVLSGTTHRRQVGHALRFAGHASMQLPGARWPDGECVLGLTAGAAAAVPQENLGAVVHEERAEAGTIEQRCELADVIHQLRLPERGMAASGFFGRLLGLDVALSPAMAAAARQSQAWLERRTNRRAR